MVADERDLVKAERMMRGNSVRRESFGAFHGLGRVGVFDGFRACVAVGGVEEDGRGWTRWWVQ